jgi:hypothetical protein
MDIKQIVNTKGGAKGAAAAAVNGGVQDLHMLQSIQQANSFPMSETGSERGGSPHDSEHSRYSAPRLGQMNGMNGGMRYPSPTAMQNPLPMLQQPYRPDGFENSMMQQENNRGPSRQSGDGAAQKAFPCSTCGKGFARRSDLARHGRCFQIPKSSSKLIFQQNESIVVFDLTSVIILAVTSSSSSVRL